MLSTPASMASVILLSFPAIFKVVNMSSMNGYDISTLTFVCRLSIMILMHLHFESVLENVRFLKTLVSKNLYFQFSCMGRRHERNA